MDTITLNVTETSYATAKDARKDDRIPVAYYAKGVKNRSFSMKYQDFRKAYDKGGRTTILTFVNEKKEEMPCIVHEIQYHPVTDRIIHVDVMAVDMNKKIHTRIPVRLVGIAPAVRDLAGILVQSKSTIEVECLPKDLVREFTLDVSSIADFHTSLKIKDIQMPAGIKSLDNVDIAVATVAAPRPTEEEEAAKAAEAAAAAAAAAGVVPAEGAEGAEAGKEGEAKAAGAEGAKKEGAAPAAAGKAAAGKPAKKEEKKK
jgi:large subunit ribosomal protein L25